MNNFIKRLNDAVKKLRAGGMVVLLDNENPEHEAGLIVAGEKVSPDIINFMVTEGRGLIYLSLTDEQIKKLSLPMMPSSPRTSFDTAFTVSIAASSGISSGISASDRAHTIATAINPNVKPKDIVYPGHVLSLKAHSKGVIAIRGHTEGSIDLVRLAGLNPSAIICKIINTDGTMAKQQDLIQFAERFHLPILSIDDIVNYRIQHELFVREEVRVRLPISHYGEFDLILFQNDFDEKEHFVLHKPIVDKTKSPLLRIHSECLTGDLLGSLKCDCGPQLHTALEMISKEGGYLIYLRQEGRGIGLVNKLKAYVLQEQGLDTVEANESLGLPVDQRNYFLAYQFLKYFDTNTVRLITNNPDKINLLKSLGIQIHERIAVNISPNPENERYLSTKKEKLGHLFF